MRRCDTVSSDVGSEIKNTNMWKKSGWLLQSCYILTGLVLATAFYWEVRYIRFYISGFRETEWETTFI